MLSAISQHLREKLRVFSLTDNIILNNKIIPIAKERFQQLVPAEKPITFIDGGQAELLYGGNIHLSFIRVASLTMSGTTKINQAVHEFYVLVTSTFKESDIWYEGKVFTTATPLINNIFIPSNDATIRTGQERAPISRISSMARRFAELSLAQKQRGFVIIDGTLQKTMTGEEQYLEKLSPAVSALAKTCQLFTTQGNNPAVLLQRLSPYPGCWRYAVDETTSFAKLHGKSKHLFRSEGDASVLPFLLSQSSDPVFLGYPYGLILVDRLARVSNEEKNSLKARILLREENRELQDYLNTLNAHEILDNFG